MKLSIIVPCYNEEEAFPHFVESLNPVVDSLSDSYEVELIFIDDGSRDKTPRLLEEYRKKSAHVRVLTHEVNRNLGAVLKTAFSNVSGDIILATDCDGTYPPHQITEILSYLDEDTDMVMASPYHPQGKVEGVPGYRLLLSRSISAIYSRLLGTKIYTYTALFKVCKRKVIEAIEIRSDDFIGVTEWAVFPLLKGFDVKEYPTTLYVRKYGQSKIKLFSTIISHLRFIFRLIEMKRKGDH